MSNLTSSQRSYLTKCSHRIKPVVYIGKEGLTESVGKATNEAFKFNEIVKVKFASNRELKRDISLELESFTDSSLVRIIGHIAIYYKPFENKADRVLHLPK
ncbi:YhbY family RNA-binding protein [Thiospirochaeta perfilievii]|uniref:YhbY family RNA-binding protein n=1 Tax=Thiospirochaeta perfilievii TaxID=252967 RepID=A0A5C1QE03_9SPIO|nr:YhbY family RNA-binding protein [Thiospirochaeta perfilievii]QEN06293.1 YhbY family RNA-binding protein [Thiospirochaeta perfilievii]